MTRISKPPQQRKREILDTALQLFLKNGYANTSVGDIVDKIGVTQGLFYYYFRTKEEVYRAAMEQYADDCTAKLIAMILAPMPLHAKIEMAFAYMTDVIESSEQALADTGDLGEHLDTDNRFSIHVSRSLVEPVTSLIEELNESGITSVRNPEIAATFLVFGIFGLIHGNPNHNHEPAFFHSGEVVRLIASGLQLTPEQLTTI